VYYNPLDWNVHRFIHVPRSSDFNCPLVNKTNNPCENENGAVGRQFSVEGGHPTLPRLTHVLKNRDNEMVERLRRIELEHEDKPGHPQPIYYKVPPEYHSFVPPKSLRIGAKTFYFDVKPDAKAQKDHHKHMLNRARQMNRGFVEDVPAVFQWPAPVVDAVLPVQEHALVDVAAGAHVMQAAEAEAVLVAIMPADVPVHPPSPGIEIPFIQFDPNASDDDQEHQMPAEHVDEPVGPAKMVRQDEWIACDGCNKWRRVPAHIDIKSLSSGPWYCNLNTWDRKNKCSVKEEKC